MTEPEITIELELRLLDEALDSGALSAADARGRELQELALALRTEVPEPSAEFAEELRERVQAGFPRERRLPRPSVPSRLRGLRRPPAIALAGAASVIVALAVVVGLQRDEDDGGAVPALSGPKGTAEPAAPDLRLGGESDSATRPRAIAPEPPPGSPGFAPDERRRRIERSASLTLAAPGRQLDRVSEGIARLTERHDGYVLRSSLSTGDGGPTGGEFELRIPVTRLQAALGDLSKLADVRSRTQSGQDVTREFASAADRLEAARAERRSLLRRLERAQSDSAAEAIRRRLDLNAGEIRGLRSQVRDLRSRTDYAAVAITLEEKDGDKGSSAPGSDDGLGAAVDDALGSLGDSVEILVRALGVAIPVALLATALACGARLARRRRREGALLG